MSGLTYERGVGFRGVGSVQDFTLFEEAIEKCAGQKGKELLFPLKIIIKPKMREVIEVSRSKR